MRGAEGERKTKVISPLFGQSYLSSMATILTELIFVYITQIISVLLHEHYCEAYYPSMLALQVVTAMLLVVLSVFYVPNFDITDIHVIYESRGLYSHQ